MTAHDPPSSRSVRTLRFRVRPGLGVPFTRTDVTVLEVGVVANAGAYATLVEIVRLGETIGSARRVLWHVNPSKRQETALRPEQAEDLLREATFRMRYTRSRISIGGRQVVLLEFEDPIDAGPFVLVEAKPGERFAPPPWVIEDVTHDPSTEIMQVILNANREHRGTDSED